MNKIDCFALNEYKRCTALTLLRGEQNCNKCNFYKTKEQFDKERKLADKRNQGRI